MDGRVERPSGRAALRARLVSIATVGLGQPRVVKARAVLDRFSSVDGGLLAAGVAYNAMFALIPLGLLASGLAGFVLRDPASQANAIAGIVTFAPPLAGVVDEILTGLSAASPSVSIVGLVLAGWGTSRLFAALESAIGQMFAGSVRRGLVRRAAWRIGSIIVMAGILLAALIGAPALTIVSDVTGSAGALTELRGALYLAITILIGGLALAAAYRFIPPVRPTWRAIRLPAAAGGLALVALTRIFVFLTPRLFGTNVVYGTLGAILVSLTWLDLVFTVILIGAAWVREREVDAEAAVV
ncbi:MAG TPA: YihY/virulence factor BrkB family protein [Candidatus Limnocylindrales bacterium]|nr:YihY/virulence factor BrkB family protein [Candidatus Limnocylindrales bacterium]